MGRFFHVKALRGGYRFELQSCSDWMPPVQMGCERKRRRTDACFEALLNVPALVQAHEDSGASISYADPAMYFWGSFNEDCKNPCHPECGQTPLLENESPLVHGCHTR